MPKNVRLSEWVNSKAVSSGIPVWNDTFMVVLYIVKISTDSTSVLSGFDMCWIPGVGALTGDQCMCTSSTMERSGMGFSANEITGDCS